MKKCTMTLRGKRGNKTNEREQRHGKEERRIKYWGERGRKKAKKGRRRTTDREEKRDKN